MAMMMIRRRWMIYDGDDDDDIDDADDDDDDDDKMERMARRNGAQSIRRAG